MTFGFESELIAASTCFANEIDLNDFSDDDELMEELGCDEQATMEEFNEWREDREDADDLTLIDWIDDIGEKAFWETSRATGQWSYALKDGEIVGLPGWQYAMEQFSEDFGSEFSASVLVARDSETPHENKDYRSGFWYLERDPSVGTNDENDYSLELISPIYDEYDVFKRDIEGFFRWLQERYEGEIFSNRTTGFHVNIGFKNRQIDPLKLLLFAGERWLAQKWNRENNEHTNSLLAKLDHEGLPRSPEAAREILDAFLANGFEKHWVINLLTLVERGYVEFRPIGNADYEKRWPEIEQHMDRFVQLMHIAADPQMYRREYQKKLGKLIVGDETKPLLTSVSRAVRAWLDQARMGDRMNARIIDPQGNIIATPELVFQLVGLLAAHEPTIIMPDLIMKALIKSSGLKQHYAELCRKYDEGLPFGVTEESYAAARRRLDPILG